MQQKPFNALEPRHRGTLKGTKWSLCVGAGVSIGLMPSWLELSRRLVNSALAVDFTVPAFTELARSSGWGLDAWTRAALNASLSAGKTEADFVGLLELHLYSELKSQARTAGLEQELLVALNAPQMLTRTQFEAVFRFLQEQYVDRLFINSHHLW